MHAVENCWTLTIFFQAKIDPFHAVGISMFSGGDSTYKYLAWNGLNKSSFSPAMICVGYFVRKREDYFVLLKIYWTFMT
jgi:hypothetical protein